MNANKLLVAVGLLTISLTSMAADIETVTIKGASGASRAEVKAELHRAIANGEIVHGDLAVFHELVSPKQDRRAASVAQPVPAPALNQTRVAGK